jgi:hypothetical protein
MVNSSIYLNNIAACNNQANSDNAAKTNTFVVNNKIKLDEEIEDHTETEDEMLHIKSDKGIKDTKQDKIYRWEIDMVNKKYDELELKINNNGGFWI